MMKNRRLFRSAWAARRRCFFMPGKEGYLSKNISAEQKFTDLAAGMGLNPDTATKPDKPVIMLKRIGSTTYEVAVHFSDTSTETMDDKVSRLIRREAAGE